MKKNLQFKIYNLKFLLGLFIVLFVALGFVQRVKADTSIDNAINFLRSKQDSAGRINTGFSAPSQWSAIAFTINNIDISTVKSSDKSLYDFLLSDAPTGGAATDWESRILAIVAIGGDPTNFGSTNYVSNLEGFASNGQIGDECSLNDDIFGLLALVASGSTSSTQIKQDTLNFLVSKQDPTDGGFGFSAPGCSYYATSADMTGAAIEALTAAKDNGLTNSGLDDAISKAKNYLLTNQDSDGGFGYYGSSDTDTTGWVLQALNVLGMQNSTQATAARNYLLSQQSTSDGGIMAFDYGSNAFVSNATTTAQAVIALSGKSWVIKIFDSSAITPTPTASSPTNTPTPTPTNAPSNSSSSSNSPTNTPTPTQTPTPTPKLAVLAATKTINNSPIPTDTPVEEVTTEPTIAPEQQVLGAETKNNHNPIFIWIFAGLGGLLMFIYIVKTFIIRKVK